MSEETKQPEGVAPDQSATQRPNIVAGAKVTTDEGAVVAESLEDYHKAAEAGRALAPGALGAGMDYAPDVQGADGKTVVHPNSPHRRIEIDYSQRPTRQNPQGGAPGTGAVLTAAPSTQAGQGVGSQAGGGTDTAGGGAGTRAGAGTRGTATPPEV